MFLYLGQDTVVPSDSVIGIFDMDNTSQSRQTMAFLRRKEKEGRLFSVSDDIPKSFIVCQEKNQITVYLSQLSSATLLKRSGAGLDFGVREA